MHPAEDKGFFRGFHLLNVGQDKRFPPFVYSAQHCVGICDPGPGLTRLYPHCDGSPLKAETVNLPSRTKEAGIDIWPYHGVFKIGGIPGKIIALASHIAAGRDSVLMSLGCMQTVPGFAALSQGRN